MIRRNVEAVLARIEASARRAGITPSDVTLVCVTKEASPAQAREAVAAGVTDIGENRVQEARAKQAGLKGERLTWHMIGHLQSNKAKDAVRMFDLIHSVDSLGLAREIDRRAARLGKRQDILLEVNVSGEASKYGLAPEEAGRFPEAVSGLRNLRLMGLMAMAPFSDNAEDARPHFRRLREIFDRLKGAGTDNAQMRFLSMGMSGDFEVAIEEGANMVRIGSAIFKG